MQSTMEKCSDEIEVLEGICYDVQPPNRFRKLKEGARARLFVAEATTYVPQAEFVFVQNRIRFRLKLDGPMGRTLVYCKLIPHRDATRQRERYFWPVRILGMERLPAPSIPRVGPPRAIFENELHLVEELLPRDFPNRVRILADGMRTTVREHSDSIRHLWWQGASAFGPRGTFTRAYVNARGESMSLTLEVRDGVPCRLVARKHPGGLGPFPSARELCLA